MLSKDQIRSILLNIAKNNNLTGESVNLLVDELTYSLYHEQLEITNALQENNLSTAYLLNSKIRNCMNVMYPVYRGRNARVRLNIISFTSIEKSKFDVLYSSNTFKVYAETPLKIGYSAGNTTDGYTGSEIIGILANKDLYESEQEVTVDNKYYLEFKVGNDVVADLSEDIQVFINDVEYPTTRNFYDYIQQSIPLKNYDSYQIGDEYYYVLDSNWEVTTTDNNTIFSQLNVIGVLDSKELLPSLPNSSIDSIFILTIPDYGIRLYKRGYFIENSTVKIRGLKYTTVSDINTDEFNKINIPGTQLAVIKSVNDTDRYFQGGKDTLNKSNIVSRTSSTKIGNKINNNGIIPEIDRDSSKSLLETANYYERLQGTILSKSDINFLFNEYFIDQVRSSINWYKSSGSGFNDGKVIIFYIPRVDYDYITDEQMENFKNKYGSYFINNSLICKAGVPVKINAIVTVYVTESVELTSDLDTIFSEYAYQLNNPSSLNQKSTYNDFKPNLFNSKKVWSDISKLSSVEYVESITYEITNVTGDYNLEIQYDSATNSWYPVSGVMDESGEFKLPTYYEFTVDIIYKSTNEIIS